MSTDACVRVKVLLRGTDSVGILTSMFGLWHFPREQGTHSQLQLLGFTGLVIIGELAITFVHGLISSSRSSGRYALTCGEVLLFSRRTGNGYTLTITCVVVLGNPVYRTSNK